MKSSIWQSTSTRGYADNSLKWIIEENNWPQTKLGSYKECVKKCSNFHVDKSYLVPRAGWVPFPENEVVPECTIYHVLGTQRHPGSLGYQFFNFHPDTLNILSKHKTLGAFHYLSEPIRLTDKYINAFFLMIQKCQTICPFSKSQ